MPDKHTEFELHEACEQIVMFCIERLDHDLKWRTAETSQFKYKGKYLMYRPDFIDLLKGKEIGPYLEFKDEAVAIQTAKAMARVTDRPLRVERVQTVRIQRQIGKVILPTGGM